MVRILIIDDDVEIREMLKEVFEQEGYETIIAPDGEVAVKCYRDQQADVVITDIIMPEKEGIETIMELKQEFPDVRIIAISGGGRISPDNYLKMAKDFGAMRTFTKPVRIEKLLEAVKELLES
ncbi:MAG: response regulator [Desulfobacteraceae bacterium]|nr:response regulator [Desulfobacteraceae bacterium]